MPGNVDIACSIIGRLSIWPGGTARRLIASSAYGWRGKRKRVGVKPAQRSAIPGRAAHTAAGRQVTVRP
jgi:hypothetical protein